MSREETEPLVYLLTLGSFEAVSDLWNPIFGSLLHALLMIWLVYRGSTHRHRGIGKLLLCMSVCAMIRLVSFAVSPSDFQGIWYYIVTEGIVLIASFNAMAVTGFSLRAVGVRFDKLLWTTPLVLLSGLVTGRIESHLISVSPLATGISLHQSWFNILMVVIFTGFTEEFIFRGIIQHAVSLLYKPWISVVFTAFMWGILHIGWHSWLQVFFVFAVGLFWGTIRYFNRGIITLALAHGMANVMLFIVVPYLI